VRRRRFRQSFDERRVRTAHVIEVAWNHFAPIGGPGSWYGFDDDLQRTIQAVEQVAERADPLRPLGFARACKADSRSPDHGDACAAGVQRRRRARDDPQPSEVQRRSLGPAQVTLRVLTRNNAMSAIQASAGVPRHRPQDTIAPAQMINKAAAARSAVGAHIDDQSANAASKAPTK